MTNLSNAFVIHTHKFNQNLDLKNVTFITSENNLVRRKFLESVVDGSCKNVNLHNRFIQISPFLKEIFLTKDNIYDRILFKLNENK